MRVSIADSEPSWHLGAGVSIGQSRKGRACTGDSVEEVCAIIRASASDAVEEVGSVLRSDFPGPSFSVALLAGRAM